MKRLLLVVTLCSLLAPSVQAQTNPCDRPAMTGNHVVTSANQTVYVCSPAGDSIDGIRLYVGSTMTDVGLPTPGTANAAGKVPYPVAVTLPAKGNHTIQVETYTTTSTGVKQPSGKSVPFVFVWEKAAPSTPTVHPAS